MARSVGIVSHREVTMFPTESRFAAVSRRAFLARSVALGAAVLAPTLVACSNSDKDTFSSSPGDTAGSATSPGSGGASATTTPESSSPAPSDADPLPDSAELVVGFTYSAAQSGGRVHNPYIAVWLEDASGALAATVSVWYQQGKGTRWLPDLTRWYASDQTRIGSGGPDTVDAVSGATRVPGAYTVAWDGSLADGTRAPQGDYFICIEAAREKGPYQLIREPITLGTTPFTAPLADNGELSAASVDLRV